VAAYKFPQGEARPTPGSPSLRPRRAAKGRPSGFGAVGSLAAVAALAILGAGCGSGGVEEGARVSVYVAAPLCAGAKREIGRQGDRVGEVRVRPVCLAPSEGGGRIDLAVIGANARRATQDTSTVGYIGETDPRATRFSSTILESAGIAQLSGMSGRAAMARLVEAIEAAGNADNLREVVADEIAGG
jgi:hypothetical protein